MPQAHQIKFAGDVQNEGCPRQERWHWTLALALDAVLLASAKQPTMPTSASSAGTVGTGTGLGDELRASASASCVAPYVCWRSVSRGIFRTISP